MVDTTQDIASIDGAEKSKSEHAELAARVEQTTEAIIQTEPNSDGVNVRIGWRSWLVVAVTFFVWVTTTHASFHMVHTLLI